MEDITNPGPGNGYGSDPGGAGSAPGVPYDCGIPCDAGRPCGECAQRPESLRGEPSVSSGRVSRVRFTPAEHNVVEEDAFLATVAALRDSFVSVSHVIARHEAARVRLLAQLQEQVFANNRADTERYLMLRSFAAEFAATIGASDASIMMQMNEAHSLFFTFPATFAALEGGQITVQHARAIVQEGDQLKANAQAGKETLVSYEEACLKIAETTSPRRLKKRAKDIAQDLYPRTIDERHQDALNECAVWVEDRHDGMAEITAILPAVLAYGIKDRITKIAKAAKQHVAGAIAASVATPATSGGTIAGTANAGTASLGNNAAATSGAAESAVDGIQAPAAKKRELPTLDRFRADAFAELLLTGILPVEDTAAASATEPGRNPASGGSTANQQVISGIQAQISIVIPVGKTATLDGYGPIDTATARHFASIAPGWDTIHTTAEGQVLSTDRRQPTEAMKRYLRARDRHCRFPGCATPVEACEIDHTKEWAKGGATDVTNTAFLCSTHHALKHPDLSHHVRWRAVQDPDGTFTWTSPTGAQFREPLTLIPHTEGEHTSTSAGVGSSHTLDDVMPF